MLNHITLMGRMTRNPEMRYTPQNTPVVSFSLAVERDYQPGGAEKQTDFIDCVAWRGTAEILCKYFTKGRMIGLSGCLQVRSWTDQDGAKRKTVEVIADSIYFADSKPPAGAVQQPESSGSNSDPENTCYPIIEDDGEFPF